MLDASLAHTEQALRALSALVNPVSDPREELTINLSGPPVPDTMPDVSSPGAKGGADDETIAHLLQLLATYRQSLAAYLSQKARLGIYTPPHVAFAIDQGRTEIVRIKQTMRGLGIAVADFPDDESVWGHIAK